jgi:serine/threonine protein kinase
VQSICSRALIAAGIHGAIPAVYDIYRFADETRYSMEYIKGVSAVEFVLHSPTPDTSWLQILAQAALILGYLEETVRLDHRDLKADNLWIRARPVSYKLEVGGVQWQVTAPFQVVFLDFGFSCIGDEDGQAAVSLTDGVVPLIDPCPKEGRDLFQLIGSMWSVPEVRGRMGADVTADMELLLKYRSASYIELVRKTTQSTWIYMAVSDLKFSHPVLHPVSLLERLAHEWYPTAGVSVQAAAGGGHTIAFLGSRPSSARPSSARPSSARPSST